MSLNKDETLKFVQQSWNGETEFGGNIQKVIEGNNNSRIKYVKCSLMSFLRLQIRLIPNTTICLNGYQH